MSKSIWHSSVHNLFRRLVGLGGVWISSDAPPECVGFCRKDGTEHHVVPLTAIREAWGRCADDWDREWAEGTPLRDHIKNAAGRRHIAHMISTGDHCLEFFEDSDESSRNQCDAVGPWGRCVYPEGHDGHHGICMDEYTSPQPEPSDAQLQRLQISMLDLIGVGEAIGRTRDQVLGMFATMLTGGRATLDALMDDDFDAVRKAVREGRRTE